MASLGTLAVNVVARTEKFTSGVTTVINGTSKMSAALISAGPAIAGAMSAAGVAIYALSRDQADVIDATAKMSDQLGIAIESLTGLKHAADLEGVSNRMLETSLRNVTLRTAEAAEGTGEAVGAFEKLNLSATRLNSLTADQKLYVIADALNKIGNQNERNSIAADLFGARNTALLNVLRRGSDGMAEMQAEAAKLGLTLSRDAAGGVEEANDAITRAGASWTGFKTQLAAIAAPTTAKFFTDLTDSVTVITGGTTRWAAETERLRKEQEKLAAATNLTLTVEERRAAMFKVDQKRADELKQMRIDEKAEIDSIVASQQSLLDSLQDQRRTFGMSSEDAIISDASRFRYSPGINDAIIEEATALKALRLAKEEDAKAEERRQQLSEKAETLRESLMTDQEKLAERIREINELQEAGMISGPLADKAIARARQEQGGTNTSRANTDLTARTAGDIDTYAAARRNMGDNQKSQVDLLTRIAKATEASSKKKPKTPPVYSLAGAD
jgi:hypothetical protein